MQPVQEQEHNWKNVHNTILFWMATWDIKQINTSIISLNIHYYTTFQIQNYISCDMNKNTQTDYTEGWVHNPNDVHWTNSTVRNAFE